MTDKAICHDDGRCEYAIQIGAEKEGSCPASACAMPCDSAAAHLTIPGALEWDGDNGTHGVVGTHSADCEHGESSSVVSALKAFANEMIAAAFEGGSFEGGDIQDIAVKHGLMRIEQRTEECGEVCACREYGFPAECCRKTDLLKPADETADPAKCESCGGWGHIETADSAHDCPECGPSVIERAVEAVVMNAPSKTKICIECDQPYCHGVCVERGDQDYDRDQATKGGDDE